MSELIQVRKKAQITLPQSVRQRLNIEEGDFLDVRVEDGEIVLRVKKLMDKDQAWFWTNRWQEGEKQAEEDLRSGKTHRFESGDGAVEYLREKAKSTSAKSTKRAK